MELLPISKSEAARYMGVKGEPDEAVMELLDRAERLVSEKSALSTSISKQT